MLLSYIRYDPKYIKSPMVLLIVLWKMQRNGLFQKKMISSMIEEQRISRTLSAGTISTRNSRKTSQSRKHLSSFWIINTVKVTLGLLGNEQWHQLYYGQEYDFSRITLVVLYQIFVNLGEMI